MVNASRAWKYVHTRCMTFVKWQTTVSIDNTVSTSRRSCHSPRWQSLRFVGSPSAAWKAVSLKTIMRSSHCRISQTPPDLVVKFQPVDIVDVILRLVLRSHVVYQREIKG